MHIMTYDNRTEGYSADRFYIEAAPGGAASHAGVRCTGAWWVGYAADEDRWHGRAYPARGVSLTLTGEQAEALADAVLWGLAP